MINRCPALLIPDLSKLNIKFLSFVEISIGLEEQKKDLLCCINSKVKYCKLKPDGDTMTSPEFNEHTTSKVFSFSFAEGSACEKEAWRVRD